jgi:hypothetical protein
LLALLLAGAATHAGAAAQDPLPALDACIAALDRSLDIGYARIAARCPSLTRTLLDSPAAAWLPADWNRPDNGLSAQGLSDLRALLAREPAPVSARRLDTSRVAAVLSRITQTQPQPRAWWPRLKQWLRELFTPRAGDERGPGLWRRLFGDLELGRTVLRAIVWAALALVVAVAAGVVINELRVAGMLRGRRRIEARQAAPAGGTRTLLRDIERAPPEAQPALLLEFIARRLAEQDRLPPARAFTAREVSVRARLGEPDRARLTQLAAVSERLRFAGSAVTAPVVAAGIARGRELLAALESATPAGTGA